MDQSDQAEDRSDNASVMLLVTFIVNTSRTRDSHRTNEKRSEKTYFGSNIDPELVQSWQRQNQHDEIGGNVRHPHICVLSYNVATFATRYCLVPLICKRLTHGKA